MLENALKDITIEYLKCTSVGEKLQQAMNMFEELQENAYAYMDRVEEDGEEVVKLRIGTILTLSILTKIASGTWPKDFTKEDWIEIANKVSKYGIRMDGRLYSEFVFLMYADYIEASVNIISGSVSEETENAIRALSAEICSQTELLENNEITEAAYIENCLWISLEAMIKLLASMTESVFGPDNIEFAKLAEASAAFAFEYGRLKLYQREQALLTEYIEHQYQLDAELQTKFDAYLEELQADEEAFNELVANAFQPGFRDSLKASAELARSIGVAEEEILDSMEKIDDFFLN